MAPLLHRAAIIKINMLISDCCIILLLNLMGSDKNDGEQLANLWRKFVSRTIAVCAVHCTTVRKQANSTVYASVYPMIGLCIVNFVRRFFLITECTSDRGTILKTLAADRLMNVHICYMKTAVNGRNCTMSGDRQVRKWHNWQFSCQHSASLYIYMQLYSPYRQPHTI